MLCEKCGGEINLLAGRCIKCGEYLEDASSMLIVRGMDDLIEEYSVGEEGTEPAEDIPELLTAGTFRREKKRAPDEPQGARYSEPTLSAVDYQYLITGEMPEEEQENEPNEPRGAGRRYSADLGEDAGILEKITGRILDGLARFFGTIRSGVSRAVGAVKGAIRKVYERVEKLLAPVSRRVLEVYHRRFPELKRAQRNSVWERIAVTLGCVAAAALVVMLVVWILSSIAPGVSGEWLVRDMDNGERLTWEFTVGGKVYIKNYVDGDSYIYESGTYEKHRKNGHNLLTITYDDGKITRLYYDISRKSGTFTNVDSNKSAEYKRIG